MVSERVLKFGVTNGRRFGLVCHSTFSGRARRTREVDSVARLLHSVLEAISIRGPSSRAIHLALPNPRLRSVVKSCEVLSAHPAAVMSFKYASSFVLLLVVLYSAVPANAHLALDNTCVHGTNYVQIVGFACIEAEERARNPNWDGNWATQGKYNLRAFELINANMNRLGIHINNITHCANFTVRDK